MVKLSVKNLAFTIKKARNVQLRVFSFWTIIGYRKGNICGELEKWVMRTDILSVMKS